MKKENQQKNRNKILVTGCAGFIGMHLCKKLLELNYNVIGIDSLNEYYDVNLKLKRFTLVPIDICSAVLILLRVS